MPKRRYKSGKCRLCLRSDSLAYYEVATEPPAKPRKVARATFLLKKIQICLPEVDLKRIQAPKICQECNTQLNLCWMFRNMVIAVEEKIKNYMQIANHQQLNLIYVKDDNLNYDSSTISSGKLLGCRDKKVSPNYFTFQSDEEESDGETAECDMDFVDPVMNVPKTKKKRTRNMVRYIADHHSSIVESGGDNVIKESVEKQVACSSDSDEEGCLVIDENYLTPKEDNVEDVPRNEIAIVPPNGVRSKETVQTHTNTIQTHSEIFEPTATSVPKTIERNARESKTAEFSESINSNEAEHEEKEIEEIYALDEDHAMLVENSANVFYTINASTCWTGGYSVQTGDPLPASTPLKVKLNQQQEKTPGKVASESVISEIETIVIDDDT